MPAALSLSKRVQAWPVLWLTAACIACLAPFANKAFHIDDTLFLYAARQIQKNPVDFYGFTVNWYGMELPMGGDKDRPEVPGVMQNPPLCSYYLALGASLFGWSEPALHLALLLPAIAAIWGTYRLAQQLCTRPFLAALAALLTPAFLVSSTNVMCDTMTLAFWVWAVVLWERGLRRKELLLLAAAAVLIALAALSKYIGVALIPLLLVYTAAYQGRRPDWLAGVIVPSLVLLIPVAILYTYQEVTEELYGKGLLYQAITYAGGSDKSEPLLRILGSLCFLGGSVASLLFFQPLLWSWRQLLIGLGIMGIVAGCLISLEKYLPWLNISALRAQLTQAGGTRAFAQYALFAAAGFSLAVLVCVDLWTRRDAGALLLALWGGGIFAFAAFFNWTLNVRSLLPLLPAAAILIARRLDQRFGPTRAEKTSYLAWPLVPAGVLALLVTWADYQMADSGRSTAAEIVALCRTRPGTPWFQGHWGFQYYMERAGIPPLDFGDFRGKPGDLVIYPYNNTNVDALFPRVPRRTIAAIDLLPCSWLATMDPSVGAGFYSGIWGPLPFGFGHVRPNHFQIDELGGS